MTWIDWGQFVEVLSLWLPDVVAAVAAVVLSVVRRQEVGRAWPWLLLPSAALGGSAFMRFAPIYVTPIQGLLNNPGTMPLLWWVDAAFRLAAWGVLLYAVFWRLPGAAERVPLDSRSRQAAATAAVLAVLLTEADGERKA